jgi:hypothetical protein
MKTFLTPFAACLVAGLAILPTSVKSQQIFDNWNTDACGFTDTASFALSEPIHLRAIELWYHWRPNEGAVGFELLHDGRMVKRGQLTRTTCDPYQEAWCAARGHVGVDLPPGMVTVRTEHGRLCQNGGSGGVGFIRAFGVGQ